jgi:hypothetical protein
MVALHQKTVAQFPLQISTQFFVFQVAILFDAGRYMIILEAASIFMVDR